MPFEINDHLLVIRQLKKTIEYNKPLVVIFVHYENAFDTIDHTQIVAALADCRIVYRYAAIIKNICKNAIASVRLQEPNSKFNIERAASTIISLQNCYIRA